MCVACGHDQVVGAYTDETTETTETTESNLECPELTWTSETGDSLSPRSAEEARELPQYTRIDGDLVLSEIAGLEDLSFLECLMELTGSLVIEAMPDLQSVAGLEHLTTLDPGEIWPDFISIRDNPKLESLAGLANLEFVEILRIRDNPVLTTLEELEGLEVAEEIEIWGNDELAVIGLRNLREADVIWIGGPYCAHNDPIVHTPVGNASLTEIDGLDSIERLERMAIYGNPSLVSLAGLLPLADAEGQRSVHVAFNTSLPLAEVTAIEAALGFEFYVVCDNLDDLEMCTCS